MTQGRTLTEKEAAWLRSVWSDGDVRNADITSRLALGKSTLVRLQMELGLGRRRAAPPISSWTPERCAEILRLYAANFSRKVIAAKLGLTRNAANAGLRRCGVVDDLAPPMAPMVMDEAKLVRLRRVAQWDEAARHGLEAYERQAKGGGT